MNVNAHFVTHYVYCVICITHMYIMYNSCTKPKNSNIQGPLSELNFLPHSGNHAAERGVNES